MTGAFNTQDIVHRKKKTERSCSEYAVTGHNLIRLQMKLPQFVLTTMDRITPLLPLLLIHGRCVANTFQDNLPYHATKEKSRKQ